jgi:pimeloyl-ACP methyl ester carboxylesterase
MRSLAIALSLAAASTLSWSGPAPAAPASQPAEVRLGHISVVKQGSGPAVVLIPGLSTPREVWSGVAGDLARHHTLYLVQVNGFGGDDIGANGGNDVLAGIVADLHSYLADERAGAVPVVGHSMGGLVALMLAADHPADVRSLMIVDALPFAGTMFDEHATADALRPVAAMLKSKLAAGYSGPNGDAAAESTAKGLTAKPESTAKVKAWVLAANPKVAAEAMAEDLTTDMRPKLASIAAPITLVHPATAFGKDEAATGAFYSAQYAGAKGVTFVAVPDSAHFVMLDQPDRFAAELKRFLD